MKRWIIFVVAFFIASGGANAAWLLDNGVAIVSPSRNNSTMELLAVSCGDPYNLEVFSRGGPVRPENGNIEAEYFYLPGKVQARIDGQIFALAAAGSDGAVVLFNEGAAAQDYLAPVDAAFIEALKTGSTLTLAFDVTPETDGSGPYETVAEFPLEGSRNALETALGACP